MTACGARLLPPGMTWLVTTQTARGHDLAKVRPPDPMCRIIPTLADKVNVYRINSMLNLQHKGDNSCHKMTTTADKMGFIEHLSDAAATQVRARW